MENLWKTISGVALLLVFLAMIILGQRNVGYTGLAVQAAGLVGLLILLFVYNRKHQ